MLVFIAALFTIAKIRKQPKCPSVDEWIMMSFIYIVEYYSATKKNEILPFATTWMDLDGIMPGEVSLTRERQIPHCLSVKSKKQNKQNS